MSDRQEGSGRAFFWGTIIGALAGMVIAVWKAPRSGKETRQLLEGRGRTLIGETESAQMSIEAGKAEARRLNEAAPKR